MSNVPSMTVRTAKHRAATVSHDQNLMTEEILYDLTNLFNLVTEQELIMSDVKMVTNAEKKYETMRMSDMNLEIEALRRLNADLLRNDGKFTKRVYYSSFIEERSASSTEKAEVDSFHGIATLPTNGKAQSKVYLYDEIMDEIYLPDSLKVSLSPESGATIFDNDVYNALKGDGPEVWCRRFEYPMSRNVNSVSTSITITLPDDIISNRDINTIVLHPFPVSQVDIDKIEYRLDGGWRLIPGWPVDSRDNPLPIQDAGNLKFCFEALEMGEIRISMTQRNYIIENHKKVFYLGAQEIGVLYTDYQSSIGRFIFPVSLDTAAESKLITSVTPIFKNADALSDKSVEKRNLFQYSIYAVDKHGVIEYTRDTLPIMVTANRLVIKASVHADPQTGATPALESVDITYENLV